MVQSNYPIGNLIATMQQGGEELELEYLNKKVREQCTSIKAANKLFGGDAVLGRSLLSRINALKQAETIKDIVVQPAYHFHKLENKNGRNLEGFFCD